MILKLRRNLHLVVKLVLFAALLIVTLGHQRIISYTLQDGSPLQRITAFLSGQAAAASPVQAATAAPVQVDAALETQETPALAADAESGAQIDSPVSSNQSPLSQPEY